MLLIEYRFYWHYRCICGGMDLNTEKELNPLEEHSQQQCLGSHAIVALRCARTTLTIQEPSHWKISEPYRLTTRESMAPSHLHAENVAKHSQSKAIGERMKRTVASSGTALVAPISSTRDHSKITSGLSEKAIILILLLKVSKMKRNASPVLKTRLINQLINLSNPFIILHCNFISKSSSSKLVLWNKQFSSFL